MYTVLTTKQTATINEKLAKIEVLTAEVKAILTSASTPAPEAVEGRKKPGRPRKAKVEAKPAPAAKASAKAPDAGILA